MIKEIEKQAKSEVEKIRQMKKEALAKLVIPFCLAGVVVVFFWFAGPEIYTKYAKVFSIYSFVPFGGPVAAIPAGLSLGASPLGLIAFIAFTDADIALFLVWNFDYAAKIPGLGKLVRRAEESGEKAIKKYKWAKRFGFVGLVLLVTFPLQWTGSAVGAIVGRLVGMAPLTTWLAVLVGTLIRSTLATLISIGVLSFINL
ncbi:MAG: hypothetical protein C4B55_06275 [Candidatus Methanophagaceae archaeon]|nr:MAG: hypothetical protein C4B55_06275 [Methanophagales archaeon]